MNSTSDIFADRDVLTVSALNRHARGLVEREFGMVWVTGEISNFSRPSSGHMYFSLKDAQAQVQCAFFKQNARWIKFTPAQGMQVTVRARVSLYEPQGRFQLIVEHMAPAGDGALQQAFDALKQKLNAEGLFNQARKQSLPTLPERIGVITSPTGAALRDVLTVLHRRFPSIAVRVYPVAVQGQKAPAEIKNALQIANLRQDCDVLLVTRGGGSLEDLWAFNDEQVARAIAASELPVIAAVGHEIDFSIADFVADVRAPTPSAAAELLSPDRQAIRQQIADTQQRLLRTMRYHLDVRANSLESLKRRLRHPSHLLENFQQQLDALELRLQQAARRQLSDARQQQQTLYTRLLANNPRRLLPALQQHNQAMSERLLRAMQHNLDQYWTRFATLSRALETVSPLSTLQRGYAIVSDAHSGNILTDASQAQTGAKVRTRLANGELLCTVDESKENN